MDTALQTSAARPVPVEFTGQAGEYFGVWFPNLLLTVVTLGIYSPWAKVRNTQYMYGHTRIDGASFAYTARPIDILKGRILALAVFLLYILVSAFLPLAEPVFVVALFLALPWLIVQALRFRYRNTLYRNVRFDFTGAYPRAFLEYVVMWLALIPTFGLIYPYIRWRQSRFLVNHTRFGTTPFEFAAPVGSYVMIYVLPFVLIAGLVVAGSVLVGVLAPMFAHLKDADPEQMPELPVNLGLVVLLSYLLLFVVFMVVNLYIRARTRNLIFNTASLSTHRFRSDLGVGALLGLWITNTLALMVTFGLAWPWARVRVARYYASVTSLEVTGSLDEFVARVGEESRAFGEEMGEVFDVDIGL